MFANGTVLGEDQPIYLHLLEIEPAMNALKGVAMEIEDGAYPLVKGMVLSSKAEEVTFKYISHFFLLRALCARIANKYRSNLRHSDATVFIFCQKKKNKKNKKAFKDVDYAVLVGGFPRKKGMLRKDLLAKNGPIFKSMGEALQKSAKTTTKVLVVANPANTNCLTCAMHAPKIPKENFCALTRLGKNIHSFVFFV